ncbi:polysaccharide deacetylase family protein [Nonomuraea aridisoli]|uniref:polysaccharide deacetylase family protein n=1 Tax=Nonomuraea aridisoli TaxID=2070368 RepID=UPI001F406799|nr:polysaccharide deacetylase family protein [Nonomuraea aridisoli]
MATGLVLVAAMLVLNGYVTNVVGETQAVPPATDRPSPDLERARHGGPMLNLTDGEPASARLPARTVALTFDDGSDPEWTPKVLDVLRRYQAKATFFVVGSKVAQHPELTRRIVAEGHELGNHTYTHTDLAAVPEWRRRLELSLTQRALAGATGLHTTLVRPT